MPLIKYFLTSKPFFISLLLVLFIAPSGQAEKRTIMRESTTAEYQSNLGDNSLDLVVPSEKVVHLTASSNPSFYFYSEGAATLPLIFTFVDLDVIEPLVEQTIKVNEEGYYKITLPPEIKLKAGKNYVWTIAIPCSNTPENFREVLRASVKYVPPSPELVQKIQNAHSDKEKAQIYAKESMWYDAIKFLNLDDFELKFDSNN